MTLPELHEDCCRYLLIEEGETFATISTYKANFRGFCKWLENEGQPVEIESIGDYQILRRFMYFLAERKLHQNTIRQRMISLKTFCKYLLFEGMLKQNPFDRIRVPKKVKGLPKPVSDQVRDKFLSLVKCRVASSKNLRDLQAVVMLELGFNCGFRKKAMRLMTWENTDLSAGRCVVIDKGDKEKKSCAYACCCSLA